MSVNMLARVQNTAHVNSTFQLLTYIVTFGLPSNQAFCARFWKIEDKTWKNFMCDTVLEMPHNYLWNALLY